VTLVYAARAPISSKPVSGRLAKYLDAYITLLKNLGYSAVSTQTQIRLIAKFNHWLQWKHAEFCDLDESAIERFLQSRQIRTQVAHDVAIPPPCAGFSICFVNRAPPDKRKGSSLPSTRAHSYSLVPFGLFSTIYDTKGK
jgi:hypothetical protein